MLQEIKNEAESKLETKPKKKEKLIVNTQSIPNTQPVIKEVNKEKNIVKTNNKNIILIILAVISLQVNAQDTKISIKDLFKFGTVYGAVNGGTSLSDQDFRSRSIMTNHF